MMDDEFDALQPIRMQHLIVNVREGDAKWPRGAYFNPSAETWDTIEVLEDQGWEMEFLLGPMNDYPYMVATFMRERPSDG